MLSAASVLVCALEALGRTPGALPPIQFVDVAPREASAHVEAYVPRNSSTIFLLTSSDVFQAVQRSNCTNLEAARKLASIIVHEEWHVRHGTDERGAYQAQLNALIRLGVRADSVLFRGVLRSMDTVLAARGPTPRTMVAANLGRRFTP
jgi:hypothetical protein